MARFHTGQSRGHGSLPHGKRSRGDGPLPRDESRAWPAYTLLVGAGHARDGA